MIGNTVLQVGVVDLDCNCKQLSQLALHIREGTTSKGHPGSFWEWKGGKKRPMKSPWLDEESPVIFMHLHSL